uniref:WAP domain-containing protein n=1 Tax=Gallus gallus TaxID=9031 RepID=A0A8V0YTH9_CHICK
SAMTPYPFTPSEGECPIPRSRGTCLDLCSSDKECPQGQKCCSNGCGHICMSP